MSEVREKDRKYTELEVIVQARSLSVYTSFIVSNPNVFSTKVKVKDPKDQTENAIVENGQYRPIYSAKLTLLGELDKLATDIYLNVWNANNIRVTDQSSYRRRNNLQHKAIEQCTLMLALIEKAKHMFHLRFKKYNHWMQRVQRVRALACGWMKANSDRYKTAP